MIELVIVLAVLGVLAAIAVPQFLGIQERAELSSYASSMANEASNADMQLRVGAVSRTDIDLVEECDLTGHDFSGVPGGAVVPDISADLSDDYSAELELLDVASPDDDYIARYTIPKRVSGHDEDGDTTAFRCVISEDED
ncbi:type II secretion system GspH family protein [Halorhodospira sp. 9622]|nr:type II secretion system GspH family protein [Halorhodospira sp. 9622]